MIRMEFGFKNKAWVKVKEFQTLDQLEKAIKKLTVKDFERKSITVSLTKETEKFFIEKYKPQFFEICKSSYNEDEYIQLLPMPNGIRRYKEYKRKDSSSQIFDGTLKKLVDDLSEIQSLKDVKIYTVLLRTDTQVEIWLQNDGLIFLKIGFDLKTWKYKILALTSETNFLGILTTVKRSLERHTASTRRYRKKHAHED